MYLVVHAGLWGFNPDGCQNGREEGAEENSERTKSAVRESKNKTGNEGINKWINSKRETKKKNKIIHHEIGVDSYRNSGRICVADFAAVLKIHESCSSPLHHLPFLWMFFFYFSLFCALYVTSEIKLCLKTIDAFV